MATAEVFEGEVVDTELSSGRLAASGQTLQQVKTNYTTAISVQKPREIAAVCRSLLEEAKLGGEAFYYGWGAGKNRIEGASVDLATAAARCFGNCAVDVLPIQETESAWVITAVFIDLETGCTSSRQFRQSKKATIHGKHDAERKDDMRFQIGQSKAIRNVILNALPKWLTNQAMDVAKQGVREKIESYVKSKGLPAAVDLVIGGLAKHGVTESHVFDKCEVPKREALTVDHIVVLRGDLSALDSRQEYATNLFPSMKESSSGGKVQTSELDAQLQKGKAGKTEPVPEVDTEKMAEIHQAIESTDAEELQNLYDFYVGPNSPLKQEQIDQVSQWCAEQREKLEAK